MIPGENGQKTGKGYEDEQGAHQRQVRPGVLLADLADLLPYARHQDLQQILPGRNLGVGGEPAGHQPGAQHQQRHHQPGVDDGGVQLHRPPLPEHPLIQTEFHGHSAYWSFSIFWRSWLTQYQAFTDPRRMPPSSSIRVQE